jgi:hypothetical protein
MKATMMTIGLVAVVLVASASGGCSSSTGGAVASDDGGYRAEGSGSSSGGSDSSTDGALYCFFEYSGVQKCVGYAGLGSGDCASAQGTVVPTCPSAGLVGCCTIPPSYEECWYCPSDPSQLQAACGTIRLGRWSAGKTTCGDSGSSSGSSGGDGGADAGLSPYDTTCSSSSMTCPNTGLICQKFSFGSGAINGYACTKTCTSTADCMAPGEPAVQCLPFTTSSFCVITCDATSSTSTCPGSAQCVANSGQTGICISP